MSGRGWLSGVLSGGSRRNFSFSKEDNLCYTTTSTGTPTSSCFSERHGCERFEDTRTTSTDYNSLRGRNLSRRTGDNNSLGSPCERGGSREYHSGSGSGSRWSSEASTDYRNDSYDGRGARDGRRGGGATPDYYPSGRSQRNIQINYNPRRKAHKHIMKTTIGQKVKWEHTDDSRLGRRRLSFTNDTSGTAEWSDTESYRSPLSPSSGSEEDFDTKSEYTDTASSVTDDREWRRRGRQNNRSDYTQQNRAMSGKYGEKRPISEAKGKHAPTRNVGNRGRLVERGASDSSETRPTKRSSSTSSSSKSRSVGDRRIAGARYKEQRNVTVAKTEKKVQKTDLRRSNKTDKSRPLTNGITSLLKTIHEHVEEERRTSGQSGAKSHGQGLKHAGKRPTGGRTVIKTSDGQTMLLEQYLALHPHVIMSKIDEDISNTGTGRYAFADSGKSGKSLGREVSLKSTPSEFGVCPRVLPRGANGGISVSGSVSDMRCVVSSSTQTENVLPKQKSSENKQSVQEATRNSKAASTISSVKYPYPGEFSGQPHFFYPDEMDNFDMQLPMIPMIPISLQPVPTAPSQKTGNKKGKNRSRSQRKKAESSVADRSTRNGRRSQSRKRRAIKKNNERQRSRQSRSLRRNSRSQSSRHISQSPSSESAANTSDIHFLDGRTAEGTQGTSDQVDNYDYYRRDHSIPTTHQMDRGADANARLEEPLVPPPRRTVLRTAEELAEVKEQAENALRPRGGNFFTAPATRPAPPLDEVGPVYRRLSAGQSSVAWTFHHTPLGSFDSGLHSERFHDSPEYAAAKSIARKYVPLVARRNRQMCC